MVGANVTDRQLMEFPCLQPLWNHLRRHQDVLLSPYLPAVFAFVVHLLLCAPFLGLETLGWIWPRVHLYRLTRTSEPPSLRRWWDCFLRILLKYVTTVVPATGLLQSYRAPVCPLLAPSCQRLLFEVLACLLVFDTLFFAWHYTMHRSVVSCPVPANLPACYLDHLIHQANSNQVCWVRVGAKTCRVPWLYRWVHHAHHQNRTPFALAAQDASPAELLSLLLLALCSAHLVGCHPLSEALFHLLNTWLAVEDHCDYDLPWAFHKLLPCMGGAPYHQTHHHKYRGNYAPYFIHWDWLFGTKIS